jgi:hypothetical protein
MRARAVAESTQKNLAENERLRRGWCLGGASFRERMLSLLERTSEKLSKAKEVDGAIKRDHDASEAWRILSKAMVCFGIGEADLARLKRSDPRKLAIARVIRSRTSVSNQWIAQKLSFGHVSSVSRYCSGNERESALDRELTDWLERKNE